MTMMKRRIVLTVFWVLSLAAVSAWSHARDPQKSNREPEVIFGPELGFRVDSHRGDTPVGALVVRVDGKWVEVEFGGKFRTAR
jgi:hypothetical protein